MDLAAGGHGVVVHHDQVAGYLEAGHFAATEAIQIRVGDGLARFDYHAGAGDLGEAFVRHADHLHLVHRRVLQKKGLDFGRVNVFAADLEHVLVAAHEPYAAVVAHGGDIAGVEPAVVVNGLGGGVGTLVVALHDGVAADQQLADGRRGQGFPGFGIDHLELVAGEGVTAFHATVVLGSVEKSAGSADANLGHAPG